MEEQRTGSLLAKSLSPGEYEGLDTELRGKIERALDTHLEDFFRAKALFETTKNAQGQEIEILKGQLEVATAERDELKVKFEALVKTFEETSGRLSRANGDLNGVREQVERLEKVCEGLRRERDEAIEGRESLATVAERRSEEVDRLRAEMTSLQDQLKLTVEAKLTAILSADEIANKQVELEFREKRLENEKQLLTQQNESLTEDLIRRSEELIKQKREASTSLMSLRAKLAEKDEELRIVKEHNEKIVGQNEEITKQVEELTEQLKEQTKTEKRLIENFQTEMKSQRELSELYKVMADESEAKCNELAGAVRELQRLLQEASTQYGDLETKLAQSEVDNEVALKARDDAIKALRDELRSANVLLDAVKQESSEEAISRLSPLAASTSKLLKSGLTLTQIYTQYAQVTEELLLEKQESKKLKEYIKTVMDEIEDKAPILKKQREDYDYAMNTVESLTSKMEELENEQCHLRRAAAEADTRAAYLTRENERLSGSLNDLGRQVCFLLKEVEALRGNEMPVHDNSLMDPINSSDLISKHLVTFSNIKELQLNNQKLLAAIRELSETKELAETEVDSERVKNLQADLSIASQKVEFLQDREKTLLKEIEIMKNHKVVYSRLFKLYAKEGEVVEEAELPGKATGKDEGADKIEDGGHKKQDKGERTALDELRKEFDSYKEEKKENEKLLNETINKLREDLNEAVLMRCELVARAEYQEQKCKTLQANTKTLHEQVTAMEKQCRIYVATNGKLEASIQALRDEAMAALTKLSVTEVRLNNLLQENALLKENERRRLEERESDSRKKKTQELLMSNLEALKLRLESSELEARTRLECRLDDSSKECAALRRRLQEEQDRLTKRMELLEDQTSTAKKRLEEEKGLKEKLNEELGAMKEEIKGKESTIENLSQQLTSLLNKSQPFLERDNRIKELEGELRRSELERTELRDQLLSSKLRHSELSDICQGLEQQLGEVTGELEKTKTEAESTTADLKRIEAELRAQITQLEIKLTTSNAAEAEMTAQKDGELASLRARVESLSGLLTETKERCSAIEKEAQSAATEAHSVQSKLSAEVQKRTSALQDLETMQSNLMENQTRAASLQVELDNLQQSASIEKESLEQKLTLLESQLNSTNERLAESTRINDLLNDQLQELGVKLSVLDTSSTSNLSDSVLSDSMRESDKLLEVLAFMRKEKSSALGQVENLRSEKMEVEAEVKVLRHQLEESRRALEDERASKETPSIIAERHAELVNKVKMLNELQGSNAALREEMQRLEARLSTQEQEAQKAESDILPTHHKITELQGRVEQLSMENTALRNESSMWQQRANDLIEKLNKTSPEDLKRLTAEVDLLTRSLKNEKLLKTKLQEQMENFRKSNEEETRKSSAISSKLLATKTELEQAKEELKSVTESHQKLATDFSSQEALLNETRNKEIQIRAIAKKYKAQFTDLSGRVEEERKAREEAGPSEDKTKALKDQMAASQAENETLRRENEELRASVVDREERAKQLLKNARSRIMQLTEENKVLTKDIGELREGLGAPGPGTAALESRIGRLEKEKNEEQAEKERLLREIEVLNQRMGILQRQLEKQTGTKPSTSTTEKSTNEPPTANIKPMAGPSSTASKPQQTQHSATVTPWRETPLVSIRPLSQQARTVVVLPTSQTTSSSQPVLVAPQQQVVHTSSNCEGLSSSPTSSHTDYMPATSSAILGIHPQGEIVAPETAAPQTHLVPPSPIALVLPQPAATAPNLQDQPQVSAEATAAVENSGVVSASGQENVSEPAVSASNLTQPPVVPAYYRQVEDSGSVASSQGESSGQPCSQQQAASSSTSVTTTQAGSTKRPVQEDPDQKLGPPTKRRLVASGADGEKLLLRSDGLEVEYQVPTSSQRDQEDDILVISDDDEIPDEGALEDGQEFEEEAEEEGRYGMEAYPGTGQDIAAYEEGEGPDIDEGSTTDQENNEVDMNEDSNEVPNQCESSRGVVETVGSGGEATSSLSGVSSNQQYQRRSFGGPMLNRHHMLISYEDPGDDSIVPSTPTLFVPRRSDGFGEAVSSPHVPSARFTFADPAPTLPSRNVVAGVAQVASEGMDDTRMDLSQLEEGTGRSVPSTPSHVSPQETNTSGEVGQSGSQDSGGSVDNVENPEPREDPPGGSGESSDHPLDETGDGVSSEGEKPPLEVEEEEGREAEATEGAGSASASTTTIPIRGATPNRRGGRFAGRARTRTPPTPIVWAEQQQPPQQQTVTMLPIRGLSRNRPLNRSLPGEVRGGPGGYRGNRRGRSRPFHPSFQGQPRF